PTAVCNSPAIDTSLVTTDTGFAWITPPQATFGCPADVTVTDTSSCVRVFEGLLELGPAHILHADIRTYGAGRFSHWSSDGNTTQQVRFAATDNSNVTTNGRTYRYTTGCVPDDIAPNTSPTSTITTNCGGGVGGNCTVTSTPFTTLAGTASDSD